LAMNFRKAITFLTICLLFACSKQKINKVEIVIIGHSLVSGVNWNSGLARADIINKGFPGDAMDQIYHRIQEDVINHNPNVCFLLLDYSPQKLDQLDNTFQILKEIYFLLEKENIELVIMSSILYSQQFESYGEKNENLCIYNKKVTEWVNNTNRETLAFLDLNKYFSPLGYRYEYYSHDGIHLNHRGNLLWLDIMKTYIDQHGY